MIRQGGTQSTAGARTVATFRHGPLDGCTVEVDANRGVPTAVLHGAVLPDPTTQDLTPVVLGEGTTDAQMQEAHHQRETDAGGWHRYRLDLPEARSVDSWIVRADGPWPYVLDTPSPPT